MTRALIPFVLLAVACGGKAPPTPAPEAASEAAAAEVLSNDERVARAAALLTTNREADAQAALADLQPLLVAEPDRADIPFNMGLAYHQLGDGLNARKYYLRATAIEPSLGAAWLNLGALSEQGGQYRRALQHYRAGIQNAPEMGELVVGTIGILRKMDRHDEAIRQAKAALAKDANNIDVYNNLGLVYIDQGKPDLAQFIYQKALNTIDGADNNATIHANLGRTFLAKDSPWDAKTELERALELDPDLVAAMVYLSHLALDDHDWERAAELLERAAQVDPQSADIQMNLGIAYRGLGQYELSKKAYEEALRLNPEDPSPYINIGVLLGEHETDFDGAIVALQSYRTRGGEHRARADGLLTSFQERKQKFEADLERKQKREAERKKREEESRLAAEYEAMQAQWRAEQEAKAKEEEAARQRAEAAAAAALGAGAAAGAAAGTAGSSAATGGVEAGTGTASPQTGGGGADQSASPWGAPAPSAVLVVVSKPLSRRLHLPEGRAKLVHRAGAITSVLKDCPV
jgi:tetratricopeptide (TPR) repeat protein